MWSVYACKTQSNSSNNNNSIINLIVISNSNVVSGHATLEVLWSTFF